MSEHTRHARPFAELCKEWKPGEFSVVESPPRYVTFEHHTYVRLDLYLDAVRSLVAKVKP